MQSEKVGAQELRKSIYSQVHNPEHKKFLLDTISEKIGKQNLAYIMVLTASVLFPMGFLYTNQNKFNPLETMLLRGSVTIVVNYLIIRHYNIEIDFADPHNFKVLFIRNFIMTIQGFAFIWVQFYLTQPIVHTLASSGTLFIFFLDYFINGVTITKKQFYGVLLGVLGVLFTVNGQFIMRFFSPNYTVTSEFKNYASDNPLQKVIAALIFLVVQFIWGYGVIITKQLKEVNSIQINFHLGLSISFITSMIFPTQVSQPVEITLFIKAIFYSGLLMATGQIFFVGALTMTKNTGILTMLSFISVVFGYLVSIIKYKEQINPFCTLGTILIVLGLGKIVLKSDKQKSIEEQKETVKEEEMKQIK